VKPKRLMRLPIFVTAYEVTEKNMYDVANWCEGHVVDDIKGTSFVRVPVDRPIHDSQTKAYVGMTVTLAEKHGKRIFKVYSEDWLRKTFIEVNPEFSDHEIPDKVEGGQSGRISAPTPRPTSSPTPLNVGGRILNTPANTVRRPSTTNGSNESESFLAAS
jgi:hypothetical protein